MPSTHTHLAAGPDRKVTADPRRAAPLPFVAKKRWSQRVGAVAITLFCALLTVVPTWAVTGRTDAVIAMAAVVALVSLAIAAPGLAGYTNPIDRELSERERTA